MGRVLLAGTALTALAHPLPVLAQEVIDNGDTETVKGDGSGTLPSPWVIPDGLIVGDTSTGALSVTDGGSITSGSVDIGLTLGSSGEVTVDGSGTNWASTGHFYVGTGGTGSLTISNGATVTSDNGDGLSVIGLYEGSIGAVTVDGAGSSWANVYELYVGLYGSGTLTISNDAVVSTNRMVVIDMAGNLGSTVNIGAAAGDAATGAGTLDTTLLELMSSTSTLVLNHTDTGYVMAPDISGAGSVEHYSGETILTGSNTYTGATTIHGGTLVVGDGGSLDGTGLINIASDAGDSASMVVRADNGGGTVNTPGYVTVGGAGGGSLTVSDGGTITSYAGTLGGVAGSSGTVTIDGAGSAWDMSGSIAVGNAGTGTLTISNGGSVSNNYAFVGSGRDANGTAIVDGAGSTWTSSAYLSVGFNGTGSLAITNGGSVTSAEGHIARSSGGNGTVLIDGAGSTWTNTGNFYAGVFNTGSMTISNGGTLSNTNGFIGYGSYSHGFVTVDGAGSNWTNSGTLVIGRAGSGDLTVANGGVVSASAISVAEQAYSGGTISIGASWDEAASGAGTIDAPTITFGAGSGRIYFNHTDTDYAFAPSISGDGTLIHLAGETILTGTNTYTGDTVMAGGTLVVGDGGTINGSGNIIIGEVNQNTTTLIVRGDNGGGTVYLPGDENDQNYDTGDSLGYLFVGIAGQGNLEITHGGSVSDYVGFIGIGPDGQATVDGAGSIWTNRDHLQVGWFEAGSLTISNGGTVDNWGYASIDSLVTSNVTVDGAGSTMTNGGHLYIGELASGSLAITNGGTVSSDIGGLAIGEGSYADLSIDGAGSNWTNANEVYVAYAGTANVAITNGGSLNDSFAHVGVAPGSQASILVDGAGSAWNNSESIYIGVEGAVSLAITNGGNLNNTIGYIGGLAGSDVTISLDGAGSVWTNRTVLLLGTFGAASLNVTNGASLTSKLGLIANDAGSIGSVLIDGEGSIWTNDMSITVGSVGTGSVTLANGGVVSTASLIVAEQAGSVGTFNIGAAAGEAAVAPGLLDVATLAFGDGTGTLAFNHTASGYAFDPVLSGAGTIQNIAGYTRLTADSAGFTGTTEVTGGTLNLAGVLGGVMNVSGGGRLVGNGTLGSLNLGEGGIVAPGNSIGTLNLTGDITFDAGSVFQVEVDPLSNASDLITVSGTATLNGGTVAHIGFDGEYSPSSTYTILTASGGVTGQFDGVVSDFAFLTPTLGYSTNAVTLTLSRNSIAFSDIAQTYNQQQVALAAEELGFGNPVADALLVLGEDEARTAFDALSGEIHAGVRTALADDVRLVRHTVIDHMHRSANAPAIWGEFLGSWGNFDGASGTADIDRDLTGIAGGVQFAIGENASAGIAAAYTDSNVAMDQRVSRADVQSIHVMGHFGLSAGAFNLKAGAGYTHSNIKTVRELSFASFDEVLSASYNGETLHGFAEIGHALPLGGGSIEPFARLTLSRFKTDGFAETGGDAALTGASQATTSTASLLGAHFATQQQGKLRIEGTAGWHHVFSGYRSSADLAFDNGLAFNIVGADISRDGGLLDLSAILALSGSAKANVSYRGLIGSDGDSHAVTAGLAIRF